MLMHMAVTGLWTTMYRWFHASLHWNLFVVLLLVGFAYDPVPLITVQAQCVIFTDNVDVYLYVHVAVSF